jgi:DNA-directed RNA polymerase specialized sigma24 family protein
MEPARWRRLQLELRRQLMAEVDPAMKVAVLLDLGIPQQAIAERLGVGLGDVKRAVRRLREVAPQLEREQRDW